MSKTFVCVLGMFVAVAVSTARAEGRLFLQNAITPAWSPDASTIACTRPTPSWSDDDMQVWIVPVGGGAPDMLPRDPSGAFLPLWLPDGQRLVYYRGREDSTVHHEFVIVDVAGGAPQVWEVPDVWDDWGMTLAPDGRRLLYTNDVVPAAAETWALDLETGESQFVVRGAGGVISPDGETIAYTVAGDTLVVAPLGQAPTCRLGIGAYPSWTPNSQYLVFLGFAGGQADLFLANRDGTFRRQLTDDPEIEWNGKISPTGDRIAYSRSISDLQPHDVWIFDLDFPPTGVEPRTWSEVKSVYR